MLKISNGSTLLKSSIFCKYTFAEVYTLYNKTKNFNRHILLNSFLNFNFKKRRDFQSL